MKVIICTMVKDEDDIVEDWILYHGNIFGYENLIIIDNHSTDATYDICQKYISKGIRLIREDKYTWKGTYMTHYMRHTKCDIFFPLDIDEFIVNYNKDTNSIETTSIITELKNCLENNQGYPAYKTSYINPIKTNTYDTVFGFTNGNISTYIDPHFRKTFIVAANVPNNFVIDHGNHMHTIPYKNTSIHLVHYHQRNHDQMVKKITNNVTGLLYNPELVHLETLIKNKPTCPGNHHVKKMIQLLKGTRYDVKVYPHDVNKCTLNPLIELLKSLKDIKDN